MQFVKLPCFCFDIISHYLRPPAPVQMNGVLNLAILWVTNAAVTGRHAVVGRYPEFPARPARPSDMRQKRIVWISSISLHPRCSSALHYLEQYEIALISWNETQSWAFDPHLICHVPEKEDLDVEVQERLKRLEKRGAKLIFHRLSFLDRLTEKLERESVKDVDAECVAGTFARLEIPSILTRSDILERHDRRYALYTDSDVIWWRKVSMNEFMASIPSQKFSVAYTGQISKEEGPINTGVILMNLQNLNKDMPAMLDFMFNAFQLSSALDQGVMNRFYDENAGRLEWSVKWNYRMFWDGREPVAIVHYWAIKPSDALDCWIKKRSLTDCPAIEKGLIPDQLQEDYQQHALEIAETQDHRLSFMKQVMLKYKKYREQCDA